MVATVHARCPSKGINMSSQKWQQQLYLLFSECGEVLKVVVQPGGTDTLAWIQMATEQDALVATHKLQGTNFFGVTLDLQLSKQDTVSM